jgi:NAD(P)-dependent dehydrogenase (short-subunit alcohol dehydrogenase family)
MENKTVLITGGGRGIGAAITQRFLAEGWAAFLTYTQDQKACDDIVGAAPTGLAQAYKCDLRIPSEIRGLFAALDRQGISLDALINNAGVTGLKMGLMEASDAVIQEIFAVNAVGTIQLTREAVRRMSKAQGGKGGSVVNISSTATKAGSPHQWIHYAAAKGAIDVFTRGLAAEVASEGIRVNAVAPGLIINDPAREAEIQARFNTMRHEVPLGRPGFPAEVAAAVFWLCSDEASYVTGAVLPVSGGR